MSRTTQGERILIQIFRPRRARARAGDPKLSQIFRQWLLAVGCTLAGVCLPVSLDGDEIRITSSAFARELQSKIASNDPDSKIRLAKADAEDREPERGSDKPADQTAPAAKSESPSFSSRDDLCRFLFSVARDNQLPGGFFVSLIWQESRYVLKAVSHAGALGIAQFMPAVAREMGVDDPFDPKEALPASARLLRSLRAQFGNLGLAAAAYNAGPRRVLQWLAKRSRLPKETRDYVETITGSSAESWSNAKTQPAADSIAVNGPCRRIAEAEGVMPPPPQATPTAPRALGKRAIFARAAQKRVRAEQKLARPDQKIARPEQKLARNAKPIAAPVKRARLALSTR